MQYPPVRLGRRSFLVGTALSAAALAAPAAFAADVDPALARLIGTFRHAGGESERRALHDAIEDVVRDMSSIARPVARARLTEANPIPDTLALRSDGRTVTLAYAAESYAAPLDGTPARVVTSAGDAMTLKVRLEKATLRQTFSADDKSRTNLLRLEGDKLAVYVQVQAALLSRELVYRLTYART